MIWLKRVLKATGYVLLGDLVVSLIVALVVGAAYVLGFGR